MKAWQLIFHPAKYFAALGEHHSFQQILFLVILCCLGSYITIYFEVNQKGQPLASNILPRHTWSVSARKSILGVVVPLLLIGAVWLGIVSLLHAVIGFSAFFCVTVVAYLPVLLHSGLRPLRNLSWQTYHIWRSLTLCLLSGMPILLWFALYAGVRLAIGQALIVEAILVLPYWKVGLSDVKSLLPTFQACHPWRRLCGSYVIVYCPLNAPDVEVEAIVQGCDVVTSEVNTLLDLPSVVGKIPIFLFPDMSTAQKWTGMVAAGTSQGRSAILVYDSWERIKSTVAHELTHVIVASNADNIAVALLEEGLACYIEEQIVPGSTVPKAITTDRLLGDLADPYEFYCCNTHNNIEYTWHEKYSHAHAFVHYLIQRNGMVNLLRICNLKPHNQQANHGQRLAEAVLEVYGVSLNEMEREWRREYSVYAVGPEAFWSRISISAKRVLNSVDQVASEYNSDLTGTEHLLIAILQEPNSLAIRILDYAKLDVHRLQRAAESAAFANGFVGQRNIGWRSATKLSFNFAVLEAVRLGCTYVGTEHLMLGLLRETEGAAYQILTEYNLNLSDFRQWVEMYYRRNKPKE